MNAFTFFRAWLADPLRVGAVAPSSPALANAITAQITPKCAPVIELGPGSGVFTRALLARGIPEHRLTLIEQDPVFVRKLQLLFPAARVLEMDAGKLSEMEMPVNERPGTVVSGLPMLLMPPEQVIAILEGAFQRLRPGGVFYQFTYGLRSPVPRAMLDRIGLDATRIGSTFANLPPARVYRIARRAARIA